MTKQSPRKSLVQVSGGCLIIAIMSAILGVMMGQYGIAFYVAAIVALIMTFVVFYFARKYPDDTKGPAEPKNTEEPADEK
ncbi:MAG TPA: hypothetical protein O0X50_02860 [Methanocorpusculum sp.]|nr:hypothetical protein [Methanocorpusculum sp.]